MSMLGSHKTEQQASHIYEERHWAAANGGVTNGGLRGVWPPFLEIGRNRPFLAFFSLFRRVLRAPGKNQENGGKRPFSSDILRFA